METRISYNSEFIATADNCAKEPIHIPSKIQPFGFLLVVDTTSFKIVQASVNTNKYIPYSYNQLLHQSLSLILSTSLIENIEQHVINNEIEKIKLLHVDVAKCQFLLGLNLVEKQLLLEFEPAIHHSFEENRSFLNNMSTTVLKLQAVKSIPVIIEFAAHQIKEITEYDRVMIYKFDESYNGDIIGEAKEDELNSFLGQKFPHTDIPEQARNLYLKNWIRIIEDVDYEPVDLLPTLNPSTGQPLDMSASFLRSISPLHIIYLQNMGVKATLTISIILNGKLWGLIACHHRTKKIINYERRLEIEFLSKIIFHQWLFLTEKEIADKLSTDNKELASLMNKLYASENFLSTLADNLDILIKCVNATGVWVSFDGNFFSDGKVPPNHFCKKLINYLLEKTNEFPIYHTNELVTNFDEAKEFVALAAGILGICISKTSETYLLFFREEQQEEIAWGGNPYIKGSEIAVNDLLIPTPRSSFEKWIEIVKYKSRKWETIDIDSAKQIRAYFIELIAQKNEFSKKMKLALELEVRSKTKEIQMLNEDFLAQLEKLRKVATYQSHTVRNPLANILGIIELINLHEDDEEYKKQLVSMLKSESFKLDKIIRQIVSEAASK